MTTMPTIDTHALARESTLAHAEMYAIASVAAAKATERSGYAVVVTADPSIGGISVRDAVHDARVYLDCTPAQRCTPAQHDAGDITAVRTMTLDIVIDVSGAMPKLTGMLVLAMDAYGEQIGNKFINVDPRGADNIEGYAAIGDAISKHIAALL